MIKKLFPDMYVDAIYDIDLIALQQKGIKGLIFDIDNTLVPYDVATAHSDLVQWFQKVQSMGFKICLVSNNSKGRVVKFSESLHLPAIHNALKPMRRNFKRAMVIMGTEKTETAIIGDQIFTDVLGGNLINITTILVLPIQEKEAFVTKIKRGLEKKVLEFYKKYNTK